MNKKDNSLTRSVVGVAVMVILLVSGGAYAVSGLGDFSSEESAASTKACSFVDGGWTKIDCSDLAAASSAQLNERSRYVVQCGDDSYLAWGNTAGSDDANTDDGWVPSGAWLEYLTTNTVRYLSCRNKNTDSDCRYIECR